MKSRRALYKYLKVWGCHENIAIFDLKKVKIRHKTMDYIYLLGMHIIVVHINFYTQLSIEDIHPNTIMESRNATFFEDVFLWK